jgi:hypothetical protein
VPVRYHTARTKVIYVKEKSKDCLIEPGKILGCIWGCGCCHNHYYIVKLYKVCGEEKILICSEKVGTCGCFEFNVPYDDCYVLEVCPEKTTRRNISCKPMLTLKNVGVASLMLLS